MRYFPVRGGSCGRGGASGVFGVVRGAPFGNSPAEALNRDRTNDVCANQTRPDPPMQI